jgi:hypothetical protein
VALASRFWEKREGVCKQRLEGHQKYLFILFVLPQNTQDLEEVLSGPFQAGSGKRGEGIGRQLRQVLGKGEDFC